MSMTAIITQRIQDHLPDAWVRVHTQDDHHHEAVVVSDSFKDEPLIARQRRVYDALGDLITQQKVHALALKTWTQAEWDTRRADRPSWIT